MTRILNDGKICSQCQFAGEKGKLTVFCKRKNTSVADRVER